MERSSEEGSVGLGELIWFWFDETGGVLASRQEEGGVATDGVDGGIRRRINTNEPPAVG